MTIARSANPRLVERLQPYLKSGEELLWCGAPDPAVVFSPIDARLIPFGLVVIGISARWIAGDLAVAGLVSALTGIPFLLVGLWIAGGRLIAARLRKRTIVYGLTNGRALALFGSAFQGTSIRDSSITFRRHRSGRHASVIFEPPGSLYYEAPPTSPLGIRGVPTLGTATRRQRLARGAIEFIDVRDADALLDAINILQVRAGATVNLLQR